jgi:hypothetical protein
MRKRIKPRRRKIVLPLPDLDHAKNSVLNSLSSPNSRWNYRFAMEQFITWYCSEPRLALNRTVVLRFRVHPQNFTTTETFFCSQGDFPNRIGCPGGRAGFLSCLLRSRILREGRRGSCPFAR